MAPSNCPIWDCRIGLVYNKQKNTYQEQLKLLSWPMLLPAKAGANRTRSALTYAHRDTKSASGPQPKVRQVNLLEVSTAMQRESWRPQTLTALHCAYLVQATSLLRMRHPKVWPHVARTTQDMSLKLCLCTLMLVNKVI
jgi:hypothetical protein